MQTLQKLFGYLFALIFLTSVIYSLNKTFSADPCSDIEKFHGYVGCNLIHLIFAFLAPLHTLLWPLVVLFFGLCLPAASLVAIYLAIFEKTSENGRVFNLCLGAVGGIFCYYFIPNVLLTSSLELFLPSLKGFWWWLVDLIN